MNKKETLRLFGGNLEIIADESETGGQFDFLKNVLDAGTEVPLHMHTGYSETIYLISGKMIIFLKGKTVELGAGEHFVIPMSTPHALLNSNEPAEGFVVASPSGFAKLLRTVGVPPDSGKEVDMELFKKICTEIGDVLLGPPGTRP